MKYFVPGSHGIWVTKNCEFLTEDDEECDLPIYDNLIEIELFGELKRVDKTWLRNISMFAVMDHKFWPYVVFVDLINKPQGFSIQIFYKKPRYFKKDFRVVPGFESVAVNNCGVIYNTIINKLIDSKIDKTGYYHVDIWDPRYCRERHIAVHRLVALAWVAPVNPETNHVVNHKDGNKNNNRAYNLEWTTHKQNLQHAVDSGLRPKACVCKAKNIYTQEIFEFPSIQALRSFLGYSRNAKQIDFAKNTRANKLYDNKYEIRVGNDNRPWTYDKTSVNIEASRYIITVTDNDKILQFNGTRSLIKHYSLWNIPGGSSIKNAVALLKEKHPDISVSIIDQYITKPIEVLEVSTGNVRVFSTMTSIAKELNMSKTMVNLTVKRNGTKITHGYRMRYQTSDLWTQEVTENEIWLPRRIEITDKFTQEKTIYESERHAAKSLNVLRKTIRRMTLRPNINDRWIAKHIS